MGQRLVQTIFECSLCGRVPEAGEYMWDMSSQGILCEDCVETDYVEVVERDGE